MGNMIRNKLLRPLRHFNVENRAEKVISRDKPVPAPQYESTKKDMERVLKEKPNIVEELARKDPKLYDRLKDVYVSSNDITPIDPITTKQNPLRPLPLSKENPIDFEFGFQEPEKAAPGLTTLRTALKFIAEHNVNPKVANVNHIAKTYNLKLETAENILKYFKSFEVFIPPNLETKPTFAKAMREHLDLQSKMSQQLEQIASKEDVVENEQKEKEEKEQNIRK